MAQGPITVTTAAASEPLTLDEYKEHLRLDGNDQDVLLTREIAAARTEVENYTGRRCINTTLRMKLDSFPSVIYLTPPLSSVTNIQYVDNDGDTQTVTDTVYDVDTDSTPGRLYLAYNQSWPSARVHPLSITINYVSGYGTNGKDVDARLRSAILLLAADLHEHAEAQLEVKVEDNPTVRRLLWPLRVMEIG